jgi:hypothetical protein
MNPHIEILLNVNCDPPVVGRIKDISEHGLSLEYEGICPLQMDREITVSILCFEKGAEIIGDLRYVTVYDIPTLDHGQSFRGKSMRRLGIICCDRNRRHHAKLSRWLASFA